MSERAQNDPVWGREFSQFDVFARNLSMDYLALGVDLLIGVVMLPFNVAHLGQSTYGLWVLAASITMYFSMFDLGYGVAQVVQRARVRLAGQRSEYGGRGQRHGLAQRVRYGHALLQGLGEGGDSSVPGPGWVALHGMRGAGGPGATGVYGEHAVRSERDHHAFGTGVAQHTFCAHCGMHPFYIPRSQPHRVIVNARALDDIDGPTLKPTRFFDGRHWEDAQKRRIAEAGHAPPPDAHGAKTLQTILDGAAE